MPLSAVPDVAILPASPEHDLGEALREQGVVYSRCPGLLRLPGQAAGERAIDLLVEDASADGFKAVMARLGFKRAIPTSADRVPGLETFVGSDSRASRLVPVRAHYRLWAGHSWGTQYRLPLELAVLESAVPEAPLRGPAPPFELLVLALRTLLGPPPRHDLAAIQEELNHLVRRTDRGAVHALLARHMPCVDPALFDACLSALRPRVSHRRRAALRRELTRRLAGAGHAQRPTVRAMLWRLAGQVVTLGGWLSTRPGSLRLARGGRVIALIGGDGAGKSTCAREITRWLAQTFDARTVNLAWPRRSLLSLAVGGALRASALMVRLIGGELAESPGWNSDERRFPGYLALLRHVCNARDRHHFYVRIQRFAGAGGVALCERYPLRQNSALDGSCVRSLMADAPNQRLATLLRDVEESYYRRLAPPDQAIVLLVDPELAVRRKAAEPADYVRRRARVIWETDWGPTGARVVDAGRPLPEVLAELKAVIWSEL